MWHVVSVLGNESCVLYTSYPSKLARQYRIMRIKGLLVCFNLSSPPIAGRINHAIPTGRRRVKGNLDDLAHMSRVISNICTYYSLYCVSVFE